MDILDGKIFLFLPMWSWAEQYLQAPLLHIHGVVFPRRTKKSRSRSHTSAFPCIIGPGGPNVKIPLKLPGPFATSAVQLGRTCELQFCPRKESLVHFLNRAKQNNVFDKQHCITTEVSGREKYNIRNEGQSCSCSTQMNSGNLSVSALLSKLACVPQTNLSLPLFPVCEGLTMSPLSIWAIQNITSFGAGTLSFNDYAKPPFQHGLRSEDNS